MHSQILKETQLAGQTQVDGKPFPKAYEPSVPLDYIQLQRFFSQNAPKILHEVTQEGVLFFRGCGIISATEFSGILSQLGLRSFEYVGGAAVRKLIVGRTEVKTPGIEVFTTNEAPAAEPIPFHNELMQNENYPDFISFFCYSEADQGGSTPLVHCGLLHDYIEHKHPQFLAKLKHLGVKYVRVVSAEDNQNSPIGRGWKNIFKASCRDEAEVKMSEGGYQWEWLNTPDDDCRLSSQPLPAVRTSKSGRVTFCNQMVAAFNGWIDEKNCPSKCLMFGDTTPIPAEVMEDITAYCDSKKAQIDWRRGDFMLIDNEMAKHARQPFTGVTRKIYAALLAGTGAPCSPEAVTLRSGDLMPLLGFGTWKIPNSITKDIIYGALKAGYRLIDCAACYGNEKEVGQGIQRAIEEGIVKREDLWITSKLWNYFHQPQHVKPALERTLRDLGLQYLDLYLVHWPLALRYVDPDAGQYPYGFGFAYGGGPERVIEENVSHIETWRAMESLVKAGLVRNIGVSNFNTSILRDLLNASQIKPAVNQIELHPELTQKKLIHFCRLNDVKVTSYSTMGGNSYVEMNISQPQEAITENPLVKGMAQLHCKTPAQVILRWAIQQGLAIIPKTSKEERLKENSDLFDWELSPQQMEQIDGLNRSKRYCDPAVFCEMFHGQKIGVFE